MSMLHIGQNSLNLHKHTNLGALDRVNCKKESDFAKVILFWHLGDMSHLNVRAERVKIKAFQLSHLNVKWV